MLHVTPEIRIPLSELQFSFARSSGPGGQNVNKVNSKALLRWPVAESRSLPPDVRSRLLQKYASRLTSEGELLVSSQRYRDAPRNVADCLEKLRTMIAAVARPPKRRKPTRRTQGSVRRRLEQKRQRSETKRRRQSGGE
ncbi:MAG: alternative ribosome rescue aminoacyl-tRNA hydrolase ArfB [Thermoguttaceae bacterium]|jgi:ribosome-associated protein